MSKLSSETENVRIVDAQTLKGGVKRLYCAAGLPEDHAEIIADCMTAAHLRGVDTHGIRFVTQYYERFKSGSLNKTPKVQIVKETPTSALVDGDCGTGQVVGVKCMEIAIAKAKQMGTGIVSAYNTNHFGAAAYFSMMAQEEGLIGFTSTTTNPALAPTGGKSKTIGMNPWSFAAPHHQGDIPVVVDMANSIVAFSNIHIAKRLGLKIPSTWYSDRDGNPTDDPHKAWLPMPFGGYKGYAVTLIIEILSSVLNGHSFIATDGLKHATAIDSSGRLSGHYNNIGQTYMAIDPEMFIPLEQFNDRMRHLIECIKSTELADGVEEVFLPGEKEYRLLLERQKNGIPVNEAFLEDMNTICAELGVEGV